MKKTSLMLALFLALSLSACSQPKEQEENNEDATVNQDAKIGVQINTPSELNEVSEKKVNVGIQVNKDNKTDSSTEKDVNIGVQVNK